MNHYDTLEIHEKASQEVIKAAYRILAQKYHPDKNSSAIATSKMKEINTAYEVLSNPDKRKKYDEELAVEKYLKETSDAKKEQEERQRRKDAEAKKQQQQSENAENLKRQEKPVDVSEPVKDDFKDIIFSKEQKRGFYHQYIRDSLIKDQEMILKLLNSGCDVNSIYSQYIPRKDRKNISFKEFDKIIREIFIILDTRRKRRKSKPVIIALISLAILVSGLLPPVQQFVKKSAIYVYEDIIQSFKSVEDSYNQGLIAYQEGKIEDALVYLEFAANKKYVPAYDLLGRIHIEKKDYSNAIKWFNLSAQNADSLGQFSLGMVYAEGLGVPKNHELAAKWYELSAAQGYSYAQNNYANLLELGLGVKKDSQKAIELYRLAAKQGHQIAQYNLGLIYLKDETVPKDRQEAIRLLGMSANQGNKLAKQKLKELAQ